MGITALEKKINKGFDRENTWREDATLDWVVRKGIPEVGVLI